MAVLVSNTTGAPVTVGANTVPNHSILAVTLAAGDADALLAAGCVLSPQGQPRAQEAVYLLHRARL
jgi:hypothetical protein